MTTFGIDIATNVYRSLHHGFVSYDANAAQSDVQAALPLCLEG